MRAIDIHVGETYQAKVSGKLQPVRITQQATDFRSGRKYWTATNELTGRQVRINSSQRLRCNLTIVRRMINGPEGEQLKDLNRNITSGDINSINLGLRHAAKDQKLDPTRAAATTTTRST
jgi:hypothetical protein